MFSLLSLGQALPWISRQLWGGAAASEEDAAVKGGEPSPLSAAAVGGGVAGAGEASPRRDRWAGTPSRRSERRGRPLTYSGPVRQGAG